MSTTNMHDAMREEERYNGWANKPTWLVQLWMTNEYDDGAYANAALDGADTLQGYVESLLYDVLDAPTAGMHGDLFGWALAHVDWDELTEANREDAS